MIKISKKTSQAFNEVFKIYSNIDLSFKFYFNYFSHRE